MDKRESNTIEIRHSDIDDIEVIKSIYAQPSCYGGTLQQPFPSLQRWQKRLCDIPENFHSLVAVIDGVVAGQIGMEVMTNPRRKHVANIGMAVDEKFQGLGVGEAMVNAVVDLAHNWLAIRRIELEVYTDNHVAIALYKRNGFIIEGEARDYAFRDGEYVDAFIMANLKDS
ncbi:GNAT family N-acetyltransferase [Shewanella eurypsychrophilus]|uniref:GNAT family N-acetyltransferase n=1 Tax=Shewanella eurypsychrophilus TaxID=2593656 RepID=A0ABX6V3J1_9GAMM|nr:MULTISPECIES: GNAT family N-acetyltransferase [Shewanella]QFU21564.1 GNAT family N-acetyltransferase [Shewanella sp. YLB-09]QPG56854.1 GNAT family N-acetyltransferase [Shewanella eurypsychrophilus]